MATSKTTIDREILNEKRMSSRKGGIGNVIIAKQASTRSGVPSLMMRSFWRALPLTAKPRATRGLACARSKGTASLEPRLDKKLKAKTHTEETKNAYAGAKDARHLPRTSRFCGIKRRFAGKDGARTGAYFFLRLVPPLKGPCAQLRIIVHLLAHLAH